MAYPRICMELIASAVARILLSQLEQEPPISENGSGSSSSHSGAADVALDLAPATDEDLRDVSHALLSGLRQKITREKLKHLDLHTMQAEINALNEEIDIKISNNPILGIVSVQNDEHYKNALKQLYHHNRSFHQELKHLGRSCPSGKLA